MALADTLAGTSTEIHSLARHDTSCGKWEADKRGFKWQLSQNTPAKSPAGEERAYLADNSRLQGPSLRGSRGRSSWLVTSHPQPRADGECVNPHLLLIFLHWLSLSYTIQDPKRRNDAAHVWWRLWCTILTSLLVSALRSWTAPHVHRVSEHMSQNHVSPPRMTVIKKISDSCWPGYGGTGPSLWWLILNVNLMQPTITCSGWEKGLSYWEMLCLDRGGMCHIGQIKDPFLDWLVRWLGG